MYTCIHFCADVNIITPTLHIHIYHIYMFQDQHVPRNSPQPTRVVNTPCSSPGASAGFGQGHAPGQLPRSVHVQGSAVPDLVKKWPVTVTELLKLFAPLVHVLLRSR